MVQKNYDLIILGGGPVGLVASKFAAGLGKKVAIIEKNKLGGTCTLTGCVPSKTLIKIAEIAYGAHNLEKWGLQTDKPVTLDVSRVMHSVRDTINEIYAGHSPEKLKELGIDVIVGTPRFLNTKTVAVRDPAPSPNGVEPSEIVTSIEAEVTLSAKKFIIATGTRPIIPQIPGLEQVIYYTNENFFTIEQLPKSLVILGGGVIAIELACSLQRLGVQITIIELHDRILQREDAEIAQRLQKMIEEAGTKILLNTEVIRCAKKENQVSLELRDAAGILQTISADALFLAVGRQANTAGLDLEKACVQYTKKVITVDSYLRTTAKNIYAAGDIVGPYQFSHMAEYQAVIAARNALIPIFKKRVNYDNPIWVTFSKPELAVAGLTEAEACKKYGDKILIYRKEYNTLDRARIDRTTDGLAKIICAPNGKIIGAHILGSRAGAIIHEIQLGKYYGYKLTDLYAPIHAYPTYSEIIWQLAKTAYIEKIRNNWFVKLVRFFTRK